MASFWYQNIQSIVQALFSLGLFFGHRKGTRGDLALLDHSQVQSFTVFICLGSPKETRKFCCSVTGIISESSVFI